MGKAGLRTYLLSSEPVGGIIDVVVGKCGHEEVTVVVIRLEPHVDGAVLVGARSLCSLDEVLGKQLSLLVEVVACALHLGLLVS